MLSRLSIKNYALIDHLDVYPDGGLNILTGETGAGKSIILGALSLILGQRMESKYFFNQSKKCIIEGAFQIKEYDLKPFFEEYDLDYEEETIIRREISADGKSRAFVNDTPITLANLKQLSEKLIDIHSQHATLSLGIESFQLITVDSVANNNVLLQQFKRTFSQYKQTSRRLSELKEQQVQAETEADYHQYLFDELQVAKLVEHEQQTLEQELDQLSHAEEIKRCLLASNYALAEQEPSAINLLKEALQELEQAAKYVPDLKELVNRLEAGYIEVKDLAAEINYREQDILLDETRLNWVNERLSLLYALQQKHRVKNIDALIQLRDELEQKLSTRAQYEEDMLQLEREANLLLQNSIKLATELSERRNAVIPQIENAVQDVLKEVGMPNCQFKITLKQAEALRFNGGDDIQFLFSANKGVAPLPVGKIASGGELSRLMLAVKALIAHHTSLPTIIFDEIDTGISGEVALKVGQIMEEMAQSMQVIAITHLPQIASKGERHYKVHKEETGTLTQTQLTQLDHTARTLEIAQMLSGSNPGDAAFTHAKELLDNKL